LLNHVCELVQKDLWKTLTEKAAVEVCCGLNSAFRSALLDHVNFVALGTKYLDATISQLFAQSHGYALLIIAQSSRTGAVNARQEFPENFGQTFGREHIAAVYYAIHIDYVLQKLQELLVRQSFFRGCSALVQVAEECIDLLI
jgi:hypothetical protein